MIKDATPKIGARQLGPDGRWIAIPTASRITPISKQLAMTLLLSLVALLYLSFRWSMRSGATAMWYRVSGIMLIAGWAATMLVIAFIAVRRAVERMRRALPGSARTIPIRATPRAVRLPWSERKPSHEQSEEAWIYYNATEHGSGSGDCPRWIDDENEESAGIQTPNVGGLALARGLAAFLRVRAAMRGGIDGIGWSDIAALRDELGAKPPCLWVLDDAPIHSLSSTGGTTTPKTWRGMVQAPDPRLDWPWGRIIIGTGIAVTWLAAQSGMVPTSSQSRSFEAAMIIILVAAVVARYIVWRLRRRGEYRVVIESGALIASRPKEDPRQPLNCDPGENCFALVFPYRVQEAGSFATSDPVDSSYWRFLVSEEPFVIDIPNFDPRGTRWQPLAEELKSAPIDSRAYAHIDPDGRINETSSAKTPLGG